MTCSDELLATLTAKIDQATAVALCSEIGVDSAAREGSDATYILMSGYLVFVMQLGFAMLCAGSVRSKNTMNILLKNVMDACVGAIFWWLIGFGVAFGPYDSSLKPDVKKPTEAGIKFIGHSMFASTQLDSDIARSFSFGSYSGYAYYMFQYFFCATAATIVSGSVAERASFASYVGYAVVLTGWVYPMIVHWFWSGDGWLSAWNVGTTPNIGQGCIDFAGSGVVHMVGGVAGLMGSIFTGPRIGRFDADGKVNDMPGHSATLVTLGTFLLWFGWYGFNPGSNIVIYGVSEIVGRTALTTTLGAASGGVAQLFLQYALKKQLDLINVCNGVLCGLVAITAGCSVLEPWAALIAGIVAAPVFHYSSVLLKKLRIDDPLDAFPMHGACGAWGLLLVGFLAKKQYVEQVYARYDYYGVFYPRPSDIKSSKWGRLLGAQLIGILVIFAWVGGHMAAYFALMRALKLHRVSEQEEQMGLDVSKHGGSAYYNNDTQFIKKEVKDAMQANGKPAI